MYAYDMCFALAMKLCTYIEGEAYGCRISWRCPLVGLAVWLFSIAIANKLASEYSTVHTETSMYELQSFRHNNMENTHFLRRSSTTKFHCHSDTPTVAP